MYAANGGVKVPFHVEYCGAFNESYEPLPTRSEALLPTAGSRAGLERCRECRNYVRAMAWPIAGQPCHLLHAPGIPPNEVNCSACGHGRSAGAGDRHPWELCAAITRHRNISPPPGLSEPGPFPHLRWRYEVAYLLRMEAWLTPSLFRFRK
ncbi:hypothetical protein IQ07DRAFT_380608 [Pyrenochaeta sp. DS3sAY3a]|nr:hypothetical protein IQ07DRAFT_380608 [Pyrenochaeta sp. DS3sAY3a]